MNQLNIISHFVRITKFLSFYELMNNIYIVFCALYIVVMLLTLLVSALLIINDLEVSTFSLIKPERLTL